MVGFPFGRALSYDQLFHDLRTRGCHIETLVLPGEITDTDGTPCPTLYRLSREVDGTIYDYALSRYEETEAWVMPTVLEAVKAALRLE